MNKIKKSNCHQYSSLLLEELKKIQPHWAVGENIDKLIDKDLNPSVGRFLIQYVNLKALVKIADFGEVDLVNLFTGEALNDNRISRILDHWRNNKCIDPPTIYLSIKKDIVQFEDGRHRTKLSYLLGFNVIPVAIEKDDLEIIKQLLSFDH